MSNFEADIDDKNKIKSILWGKQFPANVDRKEPREAFVSDNEIMMNGFLSAAVL